MKRVLGALGVSFVAVLLAPQWTHRQIAVAATPTPAALQYDEITQMAFPPATPPAPGDFSVSYQTIMATVNANAAATPAPRHGLGGMLGALASNAMGGPGGVAAAMGAMSAMRNGHLERHTYYKGWIRTDDPVLQTATISKCQEHQFITLDLAKKTYAVSDTRPSPCLGQAATPEGGPQPPQRTQVENEAPGTMDLTITANTTNLGPKTLDGIPTSGGDSTFEMAMTNATGSCKDADMKVSMVRYTSQIGVPRAYCPIDLPSSTNVPRSPTDVVVHGGCKPNSIKGSASNLASMMGGGLGGTGLVMYSRMNWQGGGPGATQSPSAMAGLAVVTQRGNVKWLSGAAADALFSIPAGFTAAKN